LTALTHLADVLVGFGVLGIFVGMVLESAAVPIPSEIILPFAGYLVATGRIGWLEAGLAALAGGTLGAVISYGIAYYGGRALLGLWIRPHELERAERWFVRYGPSAVFFGRLIPGVRTFISLPAGYAKMPFGRFLAYSVLGALPWTILFIYLGYVGGRNWSAVTHYDRWVYAVGAVLAVIWILWFVTRRRRTA
jgi:membrane protein DedA with SNARE-associated domain